MGKQERRAYLEAIRARYRRAGKAGKTAILDEFCAVCEYHRKYALRLLSNQHKPTTPAQRLLDHPDVPETTKEKLRQQLASLNPFVLQRQIRRKLKAIFNLLR